MGVTNRLVNLCFLFYSLSLTVTCALRYNYGDGSYYLGEVNESGRPIGKGKFYNTSGALEYEGDFVDGYPDGNGTWYGKNGERLEGEFSGGKANGHAILRMKNGDKMEGDFENQLPHGKVVLQRANGERVEGQFRYGMPHGRAEWRSRGGSRLDGMFRMGVPHGYAKLYDMHGEVIYEGKFINGRAAKPMPNNVNVDNFVYHHPV